MLRSGLQGIILHSARVPGDPLTRNYATLKDISLRLKSVKNIQKITKSMKMVSAAKYARAERELKPARPYGLGAQAFYKNVAEEEAEKKPEHLMVIMSSDRGLCGAIHSSLGRLVKADMAHIPEDRNIKLVCVGDKAKQILQRLFASNMLLSVNDIGKIPPVFEDASKIAQAIIDTGYKFDQGEILFNKFRSVVAYDSTRMDFQSPDTVGAAEKMSTYDSIDADVLQSYMEYSLASLIYYALKEASCSEQSSRMTAMDGASKNAGEMIDKLTMTFNRTRQAVITRELIEIISGASAI